MNRIVTGQRVFQRGVGAALLLAAALAIIPMTTPAQELPTRRVKIGDLGSPLGRNALDRRLRIAIDQVCSPRGSTGVRAAAKKQIRECRQCARADVQRQLEPHGLPPLLASGR
jgi:UrcA family protein